MEKLKFQLEIEREKNYQVKNQDDLSGLYEFYVGGGTNFDKTVMSCRPDGYVDLWQKVACNRQLWRFKKLPNGLYTISVNGETNPGKVFFSGDKNSNKVLLTAEDP